MNFRSVLEQLVAKVELGRADVDWLLSAMLDGGLSDVQIGAVLAAWQTKGSTGSELAALASGLMARAVRVVSERTPIVDLCGTGGGRSSFNISTCASFVAAAAGAVVAKHGNRAVTSACGSADVLEAIGATIVSNPEKLAALLDRLGIAFLFAPIHHGSLKAVGPVRKALEVRTIFNQVGPLANPAGATRQVIGVYSPELLAPMAQALSIMKSERALVVIGDDGMDEVSPCAKSRGFMVLDGAIEPFEIDPSSVGLPYIDHRALAAGDGVEGNAALFWKALREPDSNQALCILPSAAAAIWISGVAESFADGANRAKAALSSGSACRLAEAYIEETRSL